MVEYLIHGEFRETIPTSGLNREKISLPKIELDIYDLGGQEVFRSMWANYNEESDGLIYVIDSSDFERFEITKDQFHTIIESQINPQIPVLILLNKCDLPNRISLDDFIVRFGLDDPSLPFEWALFETSSITGEGIVDAMNWLVDFFEDD
ncbi:MAG: ADP-ribosylation factor-like protein [Asgard group archaeon]|nr:ADP-ribosylation factor-like protein [Asgard group archaeon]